MDALQEKRFLEALGKLQEKALLSPLAGFQIEYVEKVKQRHISGIYPEMAMMHPQAYVVEILCEVAAAFAHEKNLMESFDLASMNNRRKDLTLRCIRALENQ
jgi:hypothetical protein